MTERPVLAVGLQSGTSLDGMDAALVRFAGPDHVTLKGFVCRPYTPAERERLRAGMATATAPELARLHAAIGQWAADAVELLLTETGTRARELEFIAFPGQTIWHEPPTVTWQLGEPAILAERFGARVVSSFRSRDLAAGGQGAPLVPLADVLLFGGPAPRGLLNLGGMANVTFVPRRDDDEGAFAFDTGPGVAIVDAVARLVDPTRRFDEDGALALRGRPDETVLARLLADPWFASPPPRSTGREKFGDAFAQALHEEVPGPDGVATAVELTARSVAEALRRWIPSGTDIVVSGGGRRHPGLMAALRARLGEAWPVQRFDDLFFEGDAKEAVAFALLGYLALHGQPGNLPAATGAAGRRVLGVITPA